MRPGFSWRTGKLDPSQIVDPKLQYVRAGDKRLYRDSILTNDGARSRKKYGRHVMLPNQFNLRPDRPQVQIVWRSPPGFDETKFQVSRRLEELAAQYRLSLQRSEAAARHTSNSAGDERGASPARANTLLPGPSVPETRRSQRYQKKKPVYTEHSSSSELGSSESSSHDVPQSTSESPESGMSESSTSSSASSSSESSACSELWMSERSGSPEDSPQRPTRNRLMTDSERALIMRIHSQNFPSDESFD
jgi:hypothetical protein